MRKSPLAILIVTSPLVVAIVGFWLTRESANLRPVDIPATGVLTIALAGDVLLTSPLGAVLRDPGFIALRDQVRKAHFAAANLEMNLLGTEQALQADARPAPRWPYGSALDAEALKYIGFDAVALANDHTADYGPEATASTIRMLDAAGLLHAGAGFDLIRARAAVFAGTPPTARGTGNAAGSMKGRIAFISAASSSLPDARATLGRTDIAGRPGLNPLRYTADITVDPPTFETLKESMAALSAGAPAGEHELIMFGTRITKGDRTTVEFIVDQADERAILDEITAARAAADVVIVSLHSHEPANASDEPAAFVQRFARAAIDAGASLVVGHGPHRLRGVERYKTGAIFYSLGNFLYQSSGLDFRAANMYDAGADLYQAVVGAIGGPPEPRTAPPDEPAWWEGVLVEATFDRGSLTGLRLHPVDLGADNPPDERGMPRLAQGERATRILGRLAALSKAAGTSVQVNGAVGVVQVDRPGGGPP